MAGQLVKTLDSVQVNWISVCVETGWQRGLHTEGHVGKTRSNVTYPQKYLMSLKTLRYTVVCKLASKIFRRMCMWFRVVHVFVEFIQKVLSDNCIQVQEL